MKTLLSFLLVATLCCMIFCTQAQARHRSRTKTKTSTTYHGNGTVSSSSYVASSGYIAAPAATYYVQAQAPRAYVSVPRAYVAAPRVYYVPRASTCPNGRCPQPASAPVRSYQKSKTSTYSRVR